MSTITVENIAKSFGATQAVKDVSFDVHPGEIFGLLGPNGSGKTTTIRVILDIYQPDSGKVTILNGPMTNEKLNHIGYLPEERGLYRKMTVIDQLLFFAAIKGVEKKTALARLEKWIDVMNRAIYPEQPWPAPAEAVGCPEFGNDTVLERPVAKRLDPSSQFALVAALEAWADAGSPEVDPERLGVDFATGIGERLLGSTDRAPGGDQRTEHRGAADQRRHRGLPGHCQQ